MRCQNSADRQLSVWAGAELRPDPFHFPAEYHAPVFGRGDCEDGCERIVISRDEVSFSAGEDGVRVPMSQYLGVAMAVAVSEETVDGEQKAATIVVLEHEDTDLNVPLFVAWDSDEVVAKWHAWSRELGVPLRIRGFDGASNQINEQMGRVATFPAFQRRMRPSNGASRKLTRTLRRSSSPSLETAYNVRPVEKSELFARQ